MTAINLQPRLEAQRILQRHDALDASGDARSTIVSGTENRTNRPSTWIAAAAAVALLVVIIVLVVRSWADTGGPGLTAGGWAAMIFGILATAGLGTGLMALVFISNRRGYDGQDSP